MCSLSAICPLVDMFCVSKPWNKVIHVQTNPKRRSERESETHRCATQVTNMNLNELLHWSKKSRGQVSLTTCSKYPLYHKDITTSILESWGSTFKRTSKAKPKEYNGWAIPEYSISSQVNGVSFKKKTNAESIKHKASLKKNTKQNIKHLHSRKKSLSSFTSLALTKKNLNNPNIYVYDHLHSKHMQI